MGKKFQEVINSWQGGLNTKDAPHLIDDTESVIARNVTIGRTGRLQKRFGYDIVSTGGNGVTPINGLLRFNKIGLNAAKYLLIFNDGNVYTVTPTDSTWVFRGTYGTDEGERVNGTVSNNLAIFGNGNEANDVKKFSDEDVEQQSDTTGGNTYAIPTSISEAAADKKTLAAIPAGLEITSIEIEVSAKGTGDWTVTVHDSGDSVLATSTVANADLAASGFQKFELNTPIIAGSQDHFHLTSTVNDGVAVSSSANDLETVSYRLNVRQVEDLGGNPPDASIFETHKDFVFLAGIEATPTLMYWSDTQDPENWTSGVAGNTPVALDNGEKITSILSHDSQIFAIKELSKYFATPVFKSEVAVLADSDELGFRIDEITDKTDGAVSGNSVAPINQGIMFLGEDRFQSYGFVENFPLSKRPENLSEKIDPTVRLINKTFVEKASGIYDRFNNVYRCAAPLGFGAEQNNAEFVYDLRFGAWTVNTGLSFSYYEIFEEDNGNRNVFMGSEFSGKLFKLNKRYSDNFDDTEGTGEAINSLWRSKTYRLGNSKLSFRNYFDRVVVRGFITNPFSGTFRIFVCDRNSVGQYDREITQDDILGANAVGGYVGEVDGGSIYVGDGGEFTGEPTLFRIEVEIPIPTDIKTGQEIFFEFEHNRDQEGFALEEIIFEGEELAGKPLSPAN